MAANDIKLGTGGDQITLSPFGRTFSESQKIIAREERTASGRMVRDVVTTKREFKIGYDMIHDDDLADIAEFYDAQEEIALAITRPDTSEDTYTALMQPFDKERVKSIGCQYWGGVEIVLVEV
jgi:hypothetical protein